jgi:hypothetical protein
MCAEEDVYKLSSQFSWFAAFVAASGRPGWASFAVRAISYNGQLKKIIGTGIHLWRFFTKTSMTNAAVHFQSQKKKWNIFAQNTY